jgi:hypothetical protein
MKSPFWVNNVYGIGFWLKKYAYYPSWLPLCNYIEHGISLSDVIPKHEKETDATLFFRHSPIRTEYHKKILKNDVYCIISPYAFYRSSKKIKKKSTAKGTLYFPSHSTESVDDLTNWDDFIADLSNIPEKFKPIDICLHPTDIMKGLDKAFISKGYKVYSSESYTSNKFLEKFYDILKNYNFTMSNTVGAYAFYATEMGIPFSLYGAEPKWYNRGDENIELGEHFSYNKDSRRIIAGNLFEGFHSKITKEQMEFVDFQLGKTQSISRLKASRLLYVAFFKYSFRHPEIYKEIFMKPAEHAKDLIRNKKKQISRFLKL